MTWLLWLIGVVGYLAIGTALIGYVERMGRQADALTEAQQEIERLTAGLRKALDEWAETLDALDPDGEFSMTATDKVTIARLRKLLEDR